MKRIIIYTTKICPSCDYAKNLLNRKNVKYEEINAEDEQIRNDMIEKANGRRTVPQIFIDDVHIGGFDDLQALDEKGELDNMLK